MPASKATTSAERQALREEIKRLHKEGLSDKEIGLKVNRTASTVYYYLTDGFRTPKYGTPTNQKVKSNPKVQKANKKIMSVVGSTVGFEQAIGYAAGYCSNWLDTYAAKVGVAPSTLRAKVTNILNEEE